MNEKRVYNTRQKDEILKAISDFGQEHFTAADVAKKLSEKGVNIGQATVYRTIDRLSENGGLRKYIVDGAAACYQANDGHGGCHEHFHLKCAKCGELIHAECEELARIAEHIASDHGFSVDFSKTVFYGVCRECEKAMRSKILC